MGIIIYPERQFVMESQLFLQFPGHGWQADGSLQFTNMRGIAVIPPRLRSQACPVALLNTAEFHIVRITAQEAHEALRHPPHVLPGQRSACADHPAAAMG